MVAMAVSMRAPQAPQTRNRRETIYRVELKLKRKRFLFDKVVAKGEMVFSRI